MSLLFFAWCGLFYGCLLFSWFWDFVFTAGLLFGLLLMMFTILLTWFACRLMLFACDWFA